MATLDEIKEKAKTAALAIALGSAPAMQAQEAHPNMPEKEAVRLEMKQDAKRADFICENPETYLKVKDGQGTRLAQQLQMPVADDNKKLQKRKRPSALSLDLSLKRNWTQIIKIQIEFENPENTMEREFREVKSKADFNKYRDMAYFDSSDKKYICLSGIYLKK